MFNFKVKIKNNHIFKVFVKGTTNFTAKAIQATIFKLLNIKAKSSSGVSIGGEKRMLKEFDGVKLNDLPQTLRQLVGAYVYIKAKLGFVNKDNSTPVLNEKLYLKASAILRTYISNGIEKTLCKVKVRFKNIDRSVANIADLVLQKVRCVVVKRYDTSLTYRVRMKTKPTVKSSYSLVSNFVYFIRAKLGFVNFESSKFVLDEEKAKRVRGNKLRMYEDKKLTDIPLSLYDFAFTIIEEEVI